MHLTKTPRVRLEKGCRGQPVSRQVNIGVYRSQQAKMQARDESLCQARRRIAAADMAGTEGRQDQERKIAEFQLRNDVFYRKNPCLQRREMGRANGILEIQAGADDRISYLHDVVLNRRSLSNCVDRYSAKVSHEEAATFNKEFEPPVVTETGKMRMSMTIKVTVGRSVFRYRQRAVKNIKIGLSPCSYSRPSSVNPSVNNPVDIANDACWIHLQDIRSC